MNKNPKKRMKKQSKWSDLEQIKKLIKQGLTPDEIIDRNARYITLNKYINELFYQYRLEHTPLQRDVEVIVHTGVAGSGKTHFLTKLDVNKTYIGTDYSNSCTALFDGYVAQEVLFLDEFRGQMPYDMLMTTLDNYTFDVHARYSNKKMLWNTVHIESIIPLEDWYNFDNIRTPIAQLQRRITTIVFHFMSYENVYIADKAKFLETHAESDITYYKYEMKFTQYTSYEDLEEAALDAAGVFPWFYSWSKFRDFYDNSENYLREFYPVVFDRLNKEENFYETFEEWKKGDEGEEFLKDYDKRKRSIPFYDKERALLRNKTMPKVTILT